jgi:spore coat protein A
LAEEPAQLLDAAKLEPFVDPLPVASSLRSGPSRPDPNDPSRRIPYYHLTMEEVEAQLHRDLKPTRMWGFNGSSPGPVVEVQSGKPVIVEWANRLPRRHIFPIDYTLHGAEREKPECRSVVHVHGGRTPSESDGFPEDWVASGKSQMCYYPNLQEAATLYYHDHTMGISRLNVYAGLHGLFLVRDEAEAALKLPKGKYEVPLVLCDRMVGTAGQLLYPVSSDAERPWVAEVRGNVILANGKITPFLDVEPRKYRLRIANGSNGQELNLALGTGPAMYVIGSDQGLLPAPVKVKTSLLLAPGERADVIVDFTEHSGSKVVLKNEAMQVMQFRVRPSNGRDESYVPASLNPVRRLTERDAEKLRRLTLDAAASPHEGAMLNKTPWQAAVTEKPVLRSTEIWEIVNLTDVMHPVHLHMVRFQVLDRRGFDVALYKEKGELRYIAPPNRVSADEAGWKDTVRCERGQVTRIIVPFTPYAGRYVWHSHLLEREDRGMMRPFEVVAQ